ncbi:NUDIX hydrolase [Vulcanisaeta thermophila]|uniref:NUDIX hydrolase n=1 Tax=Vulcanisaeta thermophila TaxID=867917 RepID=UPI000A01EE73|nr:CoA pyrophosphatase [Vulcanisaeta thermophila]
MDPEGLRRLLKQGEPRPTDCTSQWAAVAVILSPNMDSVLIGKRTINPNDPWSGDAAFPGGRFKPGVDRNLIDTAIREAREEVGIDLRRLGEALGFMDYISPSNAPTIKVLPVVFRLLDGAVSLSINPRELSKALWIRFVEIPRYVRNNVVIRGIPRPAIVIDDVTIWGMTYRILRRLLRLLMNMELPRDPRDSD